MKTKLSLIYLITLILFSCSKSNDLNPDNTPFLEVYNQELFTDANALEPPFLNIRFNNILNRRVEIWEWTFNATFCYNYTAVKENDIIKNIKDTLVYRTFEDEDNVAIYHTLTPFIDDYRIQIKSYNEVTGIEVNNVLNNRNIVTVENFKICD